MTDTTQQLEWVKPPLQARSQQTMARLLDAAEALIAEGGVEAVTVAAVTKRASSSVGSFYARFTDKEALMRCVLERFYEQASATTDMALDTGRWHQAALDDALRALLLFLLQVLRERRHLVIAMMVRAATTPELNALMQRLHRQIAQRMAELLKARGAELDHPNPKVAVDVCVWLILSAVETRLLYTVGANAEAADREAVSGDQSNGAVSNGAVSNGAASSDAVSNGAEPDDGELDDAELAEEMARLCMRYLGLENVAAPRSANRPTTTERNASAPLAPTANQARDGSTETAAKPNKTTKRRKAR